MQYTTKLNLRKPGYLDGADIQDINANMDIIDVTVTTHMADIASINGNHGMRFYNNRFEIYDATKAKWLTLGLLEEDFYVLGDEVTGITGGWDTVLYGATASDIVAIKEPKSLYVELPEATGSVYFRTKNKVNLSSIKKLYIWCEGDTDLSIHNIRFGLSVATTNAGSHLFLGTSAMVRMRGVFSSQLFMVDVSSLSGEYYLRAGAQNTQGGSYTISTKIYRIWGEY